MNDKLIKLLSADISSELEDLGYLYMTERYGFETVYVFPWDEELMRIIKSQYPHAECFVEKSLRF